MACMGKKERKMRSCNYQSWLTWLSMAQQFTLETSCKRHHPLMKGLHDDDLYSPVFMLVKLVLKLAIRLKSLKLVLKLAREATVSQHCF